MNQEGHPKDVKLYNKGARPDLNDEILGAQNDGSYNDAFNMRHNSSIGDKESLEKIGGEVVVNPPQPLPGIYDCIGAITVTGKIFEVFVDRYQVQPPVIRIDGVIVAKSPNIPFTINHHLQMDRNDSCVGGEVFMSDNNVPPMIMNVQDMLDALVSDPQKYFDNFNPDLYYVNLVAPIDIPVFTGLEHVGGGGGLPVGSYQYALRYVTEDGDKTNRGPLTPTIPVVANLSSASSIHPYSKTVGGRNNVQFPSGYGIKLKFRVTNVSNFDYIEVVRIANNIEGGVNYTPETKVIAKLPIQPQEHSVREIIDPVDSNEDIVITDSEDVGQLAYIERAKGIRYHDTRLVLMNIKVPSRVVDLQFDSIDGEGEMIPIVQAIHRSGHNDPVNYTYFKNYLGGERYGFGVQVYDPAGGKAFTVPVPGFENYQYPNRRDELSGASLLYSYTGSVLAANTAGGVTRTFEVFDHTNASYKTDLCSFKNIMRKGYKPTYGSNGINKYCAVDPEQYGAKELGLLQNRYNGPYSPFGPANQTDSNDDHDYIVNPEVDSGSTVSTYRPQGFGLSYFSHGMAIGGITGFPKWAKSFSVVRTKPAGRVVVQGIGMYSLNPGDYDIIGNKECMTKRTNRMWFFSPDFDSSVVPRDVLSDIISNPGNYKIQLVSPLGFFSEVFNFESNSTGDARRDRIVDMISYARVLHDSGQINPGESGVGIGNYVSHNKYRNSHPAMGGIFAGDGNRLLDLQGAKVNVEGRGRYVELEFPYNVYNTYGVGGASGSDFEDPELRDFTEPFYIVNIIQEGKNVPDNNIDAYLSTGHYQKLESIIGLGTGVAMSLDLVDERWEDCIPDLTSSGPFATRDSFVYINDQSGNEKAWINITYKTPAQVSTIMNDIISIGYHTTSGGVQVYGMYTHTISGNTYTLNFTNPFSIVSADARVVVKYDPSMPTRFFGGDTYIGESVFAPIDREASGENTDDEKEKQFVFNIGFPFRRYYMNPRYYIVANTTGVNKIQDDIKANLGYVRQLVVMFTVESRACMPYIFSGSSYTQQTFPHVNYVMRPNRFSTSAFGSGAEAVANDNNIYEEYFLDYPDEYILWKWGGFRFHQQYNLDYSKESPIDHFSKPDVGYEEETEFCTAIAPSLPRAVNSRNSPGLKTFLAQSFYYLNDDNGKINMAWDGSSMSKGTNLYAICEKGVALILVKKSILSNLTADELSVTGSDQFISGEYWLSSHAGCPDEMWRGAASSDVVIQTQTGEIRTDALFFPSKESVFRLVENQISDIGRIDYYSKIKPVLDRIKPGFTYKMAGHYNRKHDEYWLQVEFESDDDCCDTLTTMFVFSQAKGFWTGQFAYNFDKYVNRSRESYGIRKLTDFILDSGFQINGKDIEAWVEQVSAPELVEGKEFIRIRVNSSEKPSSILFLDQDRDTMCSLDQTSKGNLYLKNYDGWEQFIPRMDQAYNNNRNRVQGRLLIYRIIHNFAEKFKLVSSRVQYKILK